MVGGVGLYTLCWLLYVASWPVFDLRVIDRLAGMGVASCG